MASGWQDLASTLNDMFVDENKRKQLARDFKDRHGDNGNGGGGRKAYKFGHFAHKHDALLSSGRARSRFLIDSGSRHWGGDGSGDPRARSVALLTVEAVVKHSLTNRDGGQDKPKQITFTVETDPNAITASAEVTGYIGADATIITSETDANIARSDRFDVLIRCPPSS
jgi:hypothetical protein